jgi:hypothetical protein
MMQYGPAWKKADRRRLYAGSPRPLLDKAGIGA